MIRRSFLQALGVAGAAAAAGAESGQKTRYYTIENVFLKQGEQVKRLTEFMTTGFLPAAKKAHPGPMLFLEATVAEHIPQSVMIMGFGSAAEAISLYSRLHQQEGYGDALARWESGPDEPYDSTASTLLEATDYSPEIPPAEPGQAPRIFELRTYHAPSWRHWVALNDRFAGPEMRIFHRSGIHPMFYASTVYGANLPNLTYLIPFENLAAREKAWSAFRADPEWVKLSQESAAKYGQTITIARSALFQAARNSPIR